MLSDRDFTRRMLQTVLAVAGTAILIAILWLARDALMLIYVSALIAMGFAPLVRIIESPQSKTRRRLPRWFAILVIYVVILGVLALVALAVVPPLVSQAAALWAKMPEEFDHFQRFLVRYKLLRRPITLAEAVQNAPEGASAGAASAVGTVLVALSNLVGGIFGLITILILSFYLLVEAKSMFEYVSRFIPPARRGDVANAVSEAVVKVSAWLRAQFVLAGLMGTFAAVGLFIMGVPYFYVVALIAAIGETIPIVGPIVGGVTAVIVAFGVSPKLALMVGVYFFVLHQLEANVLVPKIMEKRVGVSPVAVMVALLIGGALMGLVGAILAIPTAAMLSIIVDQVAAEREVRLQRVR
jgi:predicted PurR-regulated permease PerM